MRPAELSRTCPPDQTWRISASVVSGGALARCWGLNRHSLIVTDAGDLIVICRYAGKVTDRSASPEVIVNYLCIQEQKKYRRRENIRGADSSPAGGNNRILWHSGMVDGVQEPMVIPLALGPIPGDHCARACRSPSQRRLLIRRPVDPHPGRHGITRWNGPRLIVVASCDLFSLLCLQFLALVGYGW